VNFINNTVISNDTTASSGMLFNHARILTVPSRGTGGHENSRACSRGLPATATVTCRQTISPGMQAGFKPCAAKRRVLAEPHVQHASGRTGPGTRTSKPSHPGPGVESSQNRRLPNTPSYGTSDAWRRQCDAELGQRFHSGRHSHPDQRWQLPGRKNLDRTRPCQQVLQRRAYRRKTGDLAYDVPPA